MKTHARLAIDIAIIVGGVFECRAESCGINGSLRVVGGTKILCRAEGALIRTQCSGGAANRRLERRHRHAARPCDPGCFGRRRGDRGEQAGLAPR